MLVAALLVAYTLLYSPLEDLVGNDTVPAFMSLAPVILAGWYWGPRIGATVGALVLPLNWLVFQMKSPGSLADFFLLPLVIPGTVSLIIVGALTGMLLSVWREAQQQRTEGQEALDLLSATEKRSRAFLDRMPIGVFRVSTTGKLLYGNKALARLFGMTDVVELEQAMGSERHPSVETFRRLLAAIDVRGSVLGSEAQLKRQDREPIWVRVSARGIDDEGGNLTFIEGTLEDITESRRATEALETSEARQGQLFRDSPVPILEEDWTRVGDWLDKLRATGVTDLAEYLENNPGAATAALAKVSVVNANTAALQFYEVGDLSELRAHLTSGVVLDEAAESTVEILNSLWAGAVQVTAEQRSRTVGGTIREAVVSWLAAGREHEPDLNSVLVALSDVTERKRNERAVQELLEDLNQRLRIEKALAEASAIFMRGDPDTVYDDALGVLLEATNATFVFVEENFMDPELGLCSRLLHEVAQAGHEHEAGSPYWAVQPWSSMPASYEALHQGLPFQFSSVDELPLIERTLYQEDETASESELNLPIFIDDQWVGLIGFADNNSSPSWDDRDINLLRTAADLVGGYWIRQRAQERLQKTIEEREAAFGFEQAIAQCSRILLKGDTDTAIDAALEVILATTSATHAFVSTNHESIESGLESRNAHQVTRVGIDPRLDQQYWERVEWSRLPATKSALQDGKPFAFSSLDELSPAERATYEASPQVVRAGASVPINRDGRWIGAIGVADVAFERQWVDAEIRLLVAAADMIATFWERGATSRRLEKLLRSKDEFVASVSHELRTPLSVVLGLSSELKESIDLFEPAEIAEFAVMINEQSKEVSQMVEDLLVAARADVALLSVLPKSIDVRAEVAALLSDLAPNLGGRVTFEAADATGWADPMRLRQVLRNLLINAARYGGDQITVRIQPRGSMVAIVVSDDGSGIPEADRDRIFDAYQSAHLTPGRPGSLGLGLTVSRQLARLMGGNLTYRYDDSSIFELTIPARPAGRSAGEAEGSVSAA